MSKSNVAPVTVKSKGFFDKLVNFAANLGTSRDKSTHSKFEQTLLDKTDLEAMYTSDWISGKTIDIPVEDMFRKWMTVNAEDITPEQLLEIKNLEKHLKVKKSLSLGSKWGRLYGGALIIMGIDGAGNPNEPLNLDAVKPGSLKFLHVVDRHDVSVGTVNTWDVNADNYRMPETYSIHGGVVIHHTRVLRFEGLDLPWDAKKRENYWGNPILQRVFDAVRGSKETSESITGLVHESNVDVIRIPGFMHTVSQPQGADKLIQRFQLASMIKSNNNALLLDKEEEFEKHSNTFANLDKIELQKLQIASAASDIPITRFLGNSPGGLNATGDSDLENYYNMVESKRSEDVEPQLCKLYDVIFKSLFGEIPENYEFVWQSLWQMSDTERATVNKTNMETRQGYLNMGVIDQGVIAEQLAEENIYVGVDADYVKLIQSVVEEGGFDENTEDPEGEDNQDPGSNEGSSSNGDEEDE